VVDAYKIESSTCHDFAETTACTYHTITLAADTRGSLDHILDRAIIEVAGAVYYIRVTAKNEVGWGVGVVRLVIFKLGPLGLLVVQRSDGQGFAVSWKIPPWSILPVADPSFTVQISVSDKVLSPRLDDACYATSSAGRDCSFVVRLSAPDTPEASMYLVRLTLTSDLTGQTYVFEENVNMVGAPPQVLGVSAVSQTQTSWTIKWNQPAYFFHPDRYYLLDLTCDGDIAAQIRYFGEENAYALEQASFIAELGVEWREAVSGSWMVKISADGMGLMTGSDALECQKGSDVTVTVTAGNSFFQSQDASQPLVLKAITVPGSPTIDAVDEMPEDGGLRVKWFQVRSSMIFCSSRALCFACNVDALLCVGMSKHVEGRASEKVKVCHV